MSRWFLMGCSVAAFLAASKAHGRQLRLERELAGHWHVTFGAPNHPFVEALWQRERMIYWSITATLIAVSLAYVLLAPQKGWPLPLARRGERSWWGGIPMVAIWPFVVAFTITGVMSLVRLLRSAANADRMWLQQAMWGSAGWWALTLVLAVALVYLVRQGQSA